MLDSIPDDCLTHLYNIESSLFLTCKRLYSISNVVFNEILKRDYKMLIRNNYLENAMKTYHCIYNVYGSEFVLCKDKLSNLIIKSLSTNNIELLGLLYKTFPNVINSQTIKLKLSTEIIKNKRIDDIEFITTLYNIIPSIMNLQIIKFDLLKRAIYIKSLPIINYLLSQTPLLSTYDTQEIIRYYFIYKINMPIIIDNIINTYDDHDYKEFIITLSLVYNDMQLFNLNVNDDNATELLIRAINASNKEACKYIMTTFKYDETIVRNTVGSNDKSYVFYTLLKISTS